MSQNDANDYLCRSEITVYQHRNLVEIKALAL